MNFSLGSFFKGFLVGALMLLVNGMLVAQTPDTLEIFQIEYFFDTDPGFGNGGAGNGGQINTTFDSLFISVETLNTGTLSTGFHVLGFRARNLAPRPSFYDSVKSAVDTTVVGPLKPTNWIDPTLLSNSMWGMTETRLVFVDQSENGVASLVDSLEYFFDEDPGVGSATIIDAFTAANQIVLTNEILTSDTLGFGFHVLGMRAKAEGGAWGTTETRLVFVDLSSSGTASLVDSLEYFYDVDPGVGSATIIDGFTAANQIALSNEVLTSDTLSFGFHVLGMRAKVEGGSWGTTETRLVFVDQSETGAVPVDSLEYFFDIDPGVGNATVIDGFTAANTIALNNQVLVSDTLSFGFHVLGMRAKAVGGSWGTTETRLVFADLSSSGTASLVDSLEYFFDEDPGVGNAIIIDGFTAANQIALSNQILTADTLSFGFHVLGMRAKAEGGSWGTTETRLVFVDPSGSGSIINVDQIEYFFDVDPGVGSATIFTAFTANNEISVVESLNSSGLSRGFHLLGIRARAEGGNWGTTETQLVYVDQAGVMTNVVEIEYFVRDDPGVGLATNLPFSSPGTNVMETFTLNTDTISVGTEYQIHFRARDDQGRWSTTETRRIRATNLNPPVVSSNDSITNTSPANLLITFDEDVTGFSSTAFMVENGSVDAASFVDNGDNTFNVNINLDTEGPVKVTVMDSAAFAVDDNNPSPATSYEIFYDLTAPIITVDNLVSNDVSPALSGTVDDDSASVSITVAGMSYPATSVSGGIWTLDAGIINPLSAGTYDVQAAATDLGGNVGVDGTTDELTIDVVDFAILPASSITDTSFVANWTGGVDLVNYQIDVSSSSDFTTFLPGLENFETTSSSVVVTDLDFGTNYYYRARFVNTSSDVSPNSDVITIKTLIDSTTTADSLALAAMYTSVAPQGLNWETDRLKDWIGVTLDDQKRRVLAVDISNAQASGNLPNPFDAEILLDNGLSALTSFNGSNNQLTGLIDFAATSIQDLDVSANNLTFEDLEPLQGLGLTTFNYVSQAAVPFIAESDNAFLKDTELDRLGVVRIVPRGDNYSLLTGLNGANNTYTWTRDGTSISGDRYVINGNALTINGIDLDNMGLFGAEVTNASFPELTLTMVPEHVFAVVDLEMRLTDFNDVLLPGNEQFIGALLETEVRAAGYDTLARTPRNTTVSSSFIFNDVILGNYLCGIDPLNRELYVPTYFGDAFTWEEADTIEVRTTETLIVRMTEEPTVESGPGNLGGVIEEDFGDEGARITARRRAKKRKCGLRRRRTGGRTDQEEGVFELFAYGETDDNGEFEFGFLPEGVYQFFVEYPGIPLDESAFVQFEVGELGISDTEFSLNAFATEGGVAVSIERVLGVILTYFKDLSVFPNPANDFVRIQYRHLKSKDVMAELVDLKGKVMWEQAIRNGYDGRVDIDVSGLMEGNYILRFYDKTSREENVVSYRVIVR